MGRRDRAHRERVIAGLEPPHRVPTPQSQYYTCQTCGEWLTEYQVEEHRCFKEKAACQFSDLGATIIKPGAQPPQCGKKALYFRVLRSPTGPVGMALCGEHAALVEGVAKRPASGASAGQGGPVAPAGVVGVPQTSTPPA